MKCDNCGENEANVKYTQIINGEKKVMHLCERCSEELGINNMNFNMPIDFSSFLSDFFDDMSDENILPEIEGLSNEVKCSRCGLSFDDFMHTGKFGCSNCYDEFELKIDPILKSIHGANRHIGRLGKVNENNEINVLKESKNMNKNFAGNKEDINIKNNKEDKSRKLEKLNEDLKQAIREERYEDAAKIRDKIKKI